MNRYLLILSCFFLASCQQPNKRTNVEAAKDSLTVDTTQVTNVGEDNTGLKEIVVDRALFKKLYAGLRRKGDEFSENKFLFDKSSPQFVNRNGVFCYINATKNEPPTLVFAIQYYSDDWLFIKEATFNIDGENFEYNPLRSFKTDNGDGGMIWEWSHETVSLSDYRLLMKLATGKKAKVKYNGSQYSDIVNISKNQQLAIKKILQVYKGLLLHYNT